MRVVSFLRLASLGRLKPSTAPIASHRPDASPEPPPTSRSAEEDKLFENSLAQLGDLEGDDPFKQVSARASRARPRVSRAVEESPDGEPVASSRRRRPLRPSVNPLPKP